jgi:glycosyltransferase involved in cell wall biosynthesis
MSKPIVTVCIATCNQRDFIDSCIRSVAEQESDAELRILVGDDASNDGTSEIVARLVTEYPDRIQHIRREPRMGALANMRDLMTRADGEFIARTDGDDYWLPSKLAKQIAYLKSHPNCAAVYTNAITVDQAGNRIGLFNDVGDGQFDLANLLRRGNFLNNSSVLFRTVGRQAWLRVDVAQIDYRAHLWHARHGWLGHIGEPLAAYRVNTQGSMVANMNDSVRELYWQAIQSVPRDMVSDDDFAHGIADFQRRVFFRAIRTGRWGLLREWAPRVFRASPYGATRTRLLVVGSIVRITYKELIGLFQNGSDGRRLKVLYRR